MSVVGGDDDERVFELAELLQLGESGANGVVKLEKLGKSAVVVQGVLETSRQCQLASAVG